MYIWHIHDQIPTISVPCGYLYIRVIASVWVVSSQYRLLFVGVWTVWFFLCLHYFPLTWKFNIFFKYNHKTSVIFLKWAGRCRYRGADQSAMSSRNTQREREHIGAPNNSTLLSVTSHLHNLRLVIRSHHVRRRALSGRWCCIIVSCGYRVSIIVLSTSKLTHRLSIYQLRSEK